MIGALVLAFVSVPFVQERAAVTPRVEEARTLRYALEERRRTQVGEESASESRDLSCEFSLALTPKVDGGARGKLRYESVALEFLTPQLRLRYDSRKPEEADTSDARLKKAVDGVVGATLMVDFRADGDVDGIAGLEALAEVPGSMLLTRLVEPKSVTTTLERLFTVRAERARVTAGDTWTVTRKTELTPDTRVVLDLECRVDRVVDGVAEVRLTGKTRFETEPGVTAPVTLRDQSIQGRLRWDAERRLVTLFQLNTELTLDPGGEAPVQRTEQRTLVRLLD